MIRVPLIVLMPKSFPRKKRIASQVRLIDIMPTVLESVGIPYEKSTIQGVSLLPLMTGQKNLAELVAFTEATAVGPEKKSVRTLRKKYISETDMPDNNMWERIFVPENPDIEMLYDLIRDPEEKTNIAQENPKQVKLLSKQLLNLMGEAVRQHSKQQTSRRIVVDEAMKQRLKELGYIQ
jgi:arylsulfatase A-like enzyme